MRSVRRVRGRFVGASGLRKIAGPPGSAYEVIVIDELGVPVGYLTEWYRLRKGPGPDRTRSTYLDLPLPFAGYLRRHEHPWNAEPARIRAWVRAFLLESGCVVRPDAAWDGYQVESSAAAPFTIGALRPNAMMSCTSRLHNLLDDVRRVSGVRELAELTPERWRALARLVEMTPVRRDEFHTYATLTKRHWPSYLDRLDNLRIQAGQHRRLMPIRSVDHDASPRTGVPYFDGIFRQVEAHAFAVPTHFPTCELLVRQVHVATLVGDEVQPLLKQPHEELPVVAATVEDHHKALIPDHLAYRSNHGRQALGQVATYLLSHHQQGTAMQIIHEILDDAWQRHPPLRVPHLGHQPAGVVDLGPRTLSVPTRREQDRAIILACEVRGQSVEQALERENGPHAYPVLYPGAYPGCAPDSRPIHGDRWECV